MIMMKNAAEFNCDILSDLKKKQTQQLFNCLCTNKMK